MAFKKISPIYYMADSIKDLHEIKDAQMGAECYVIEVAAEYICTSYGKWFKQNKNSINIDGGNVNLEGYATEEYVDNAVEECAKIDDPVFKMFNYNDSSKTLFSLSTYANEKKSLVEKMNEAGMGLYTFYCEKGSFDLPDEVLAKNSSTRGIAVVDTWRNPTNWYGWILMIDHDGESYVRYIRDSIPSVWHKITDVADWES